MADDATTTSKIHEHPSVEIARLRAKCERAVDKLLGILDALGPDADEEPSLGFSEPGSPHSWSGLDQMHIAEGATDGREDEHDGREPPEDPEETLGRSENFDQRRVEFGQDDREPSLGSTSHLDQRGWAAGDVHALLDGEVQCEDEGAQCDDEGAHDHQGACEYADDGDGGPDQRRLAGNHPMGQPLGQSGC